MIAYNNGMCGLYNPPPPASQNTSKHERRWQSLRDCFAIASRSLRDCFAIASRSVRDRFAIVYRRSLVRKMRKLED